MPPKSYSQNSSPYPPKGYENIKTRKLQLITVGVIAAIIATALIVLLGSNSQQSKYLKSATVAARKQIPNAKVADVKVADGFALAAVSDPTAQGQAAAGNQIYFKLNKDGSMTQLAAGSSLSPVDLSGLGISLATQAKLTGRNLAQVQEDLAATCGYVGGDEPGYVGFGSSFNPGGWQIDSGTLNGIEQALTAMLSGKNAPLKVSDKIICVDASREKSNASINQQTYISTFVLNLQFINGNGAATAHPFTFALGPNHYRAYTLDGQTIQNQ